MKKIILVNSLGLGGAERVISRLCDAEVMADVELVTFKANRFYDTKLTPNVLKSWLSRFHYFLGLESGATIQAHLNSAILFISFIGLFKNITVQPVHCFAYSAFYKRKGFIGRLHRLIFSVLLKRADLHIFKAIEMVKDFEDTFGWLPVNYKVIYNPYNIRDIKAASESKKRQVTIKNDGINIAIVGRLTSSKRPLDVIEIASNFAEDVSFHFIGDGTLRSDLESVVKERRLRNITFHGSLSDPFSLLSECDFYLSCSEAEGFPNALVEALIIGLVPIHSLCLTGPAEILAGSDDKPVIEPYEFFIGKRGYLFNTGELSGAVKAIRYAIENREIKSLEFLNASSEFTDMLDVSIIAKKYYNCFRGVYEKV